MSFVRASRFCRALPSLISLVRQETLSAPFSYGRIKTLPLRGLTTQAEAVQPVGKFTPRPSSSVNRQMIIVETNLYRYGRVSLNQVNGLIQEIEKTGNVTAAQAVLVFRVMGSVLFDEHPNSRVELAQKTWEKFEKLGLEFDVTHYNALLRCYLQNKHSVSPSAFLENMEKKQIQPNRVTYQNLISQFCENGDIAGASQILEYMKKLELPIGEQVFNSLITGHFRAKEPENAEGILTIMRKAGMEPSADTYITLIMGYIESGQADKLDSILERADNESVLIRPPHLLKLIYELTLNNEKEAIPKLLTKLSEFGGINQDAISWINQLICQGQEDVAFQIFSIMPKPIQRDNVELTLGRFFIRALVRNERPVDVVCNYVNKMRQEGCNKDDLSFATHLAYIYEKTDYAMELIKKMESENIPVRNHYFWPALCQYVDAGNKEGFVKALKMIKSMNLDEGISLTFHEYIIPGLQKFGYTYEEGAAVLEEIGFSVHEINFAYFIHLLETKDMPSALEFAHGKSMMIIVGALRSVLMRQYKDTNDWKSVIQILQLSASLLAPRNMLANVAGDWLALVIYHKKWDEIEVIIDEMISHKINVNKQFYQGVSNVTIPDEIRQKIDSLLDDSKETSFSKLAVSDMTVEELTDLAQTTNNKTARKWLLIRHCAIGNVKEAENLKASLDAEGFLFPPIILRQLMFMNALHKKDETVAMEYLHLLQNQYPEYADYTKALLNLATLLVNNGKPTDAMKILKNYADTYGDQMKEQKFNTTYILENDCLALIKSVVKTAEPETAKQFLQMLFDLGYIKPATFELIESVMKGFIERNELTHCIKLLEWMITEYKRAPCIDALLQMFIKAEDPEKLQKVMDLVIPIHGEMNVLHQLMVNLIESGHLKKARKVLETPGLRAAMIRIKIGCENFINQNKITELEQLVEITKDMFGLDREEMLFQLIRGYVKIEDYKKAQDVLTKYEEEDLSPSGRTLRYLSKAMKGAGLDITFDVPTVYDEKLSDILNLEDDIFRHVQENRFRSAKTMIRKLEASHQCSSDLLMKIAEFLSQLNRPNDVGWVIQLLADHGDVESLLLLKAKKIVTNVDILNKCLFTAYVNSNRTQELISYLNENLDSVGSFISVKGLTGIVETNPDQVSQIEELAEKCSLPNQRSILWPLWQTLFYMNPKCPKAEAIFQKQPEMSSQMSILGLCQKSLREQRLDVLTEMQHLFHTKKQTVGFITSYIVLLHARKGDVERCLSAIESLKEKDLDESNLTKIALKEAGELLTAKNKPIPWENKTATDSSDSSDDESILKGSRQ